MWLITIKYNKAKSRQEIQTNSQTLKEEQPNIRSIREYYTVMKARRFGALNCSYEGTDNLQRPIRANQRVEQVLQTLSVPSAEIQYRRKHNKTKV